MFYCKDCAKKNVWPTDFYLPRSRGACELCKKKAICFDVHHSALPQKQEIPDA